jgi:hypothetical protein
MRTSTHPLQSWQQWYAILVHVIYYTNVLRRGATNNKDNSRKINTLIENTYLSVTVIQDDAYASLCRVHCVCSSVPGK